MLVSGGVAGARIANMGLLASETGRIGNGSAAKRVAAVPTSKTALPGFGRIEAVTGTDVAYEHDIRGKVQMARGRSLLAHADPARSPGDVCKSFYFPSATELRSRF